MATIHERRIIIIYPWQARFRGRRASNHPTLLLQRAPGQIGNPLWLRPDRTETPRRLDLPHAAAALVDVVRVREHHAPLVEG